MPKEPRIKNDIDSSGVYEGVSLEDMGYGHLVKKAPESEPDTDTETDEGADDVTAESD